MPNTVSYQQARTSCRNDNKDLCSSNEICKDGKTPHSGPLSGDHWTPVSDSQNEWLQIGNDENHLKLPHDNFLNSFTFFCSRILSVLFIIDFSLQFQENLHIVRVISTVI